MTATPSPRRRRVRMVVITLLLIAAAGAAGTWYVTNAQWREVTDNAYVQGNLVRIAPKVPGQVVQMLREEGEWVEAGTILAVLAPGPQRLRL